MYMLGLGLGLGEYFFWGYRRRGFDVRKKCGVKEIAFLDFERNLICTICAGLFLTTATRYTERSVRKHTV